MKAPRASVRRVGETAARQRANAPTRKSDADRYSSQQALPGAKGLFEHAWIDRDLGWLEFNRRVLHEALDERTPLLERLKFLAIFSANLDEFYMKRIGLLRSRARAEHDEGMALREGDARDLLRRIREVSLEMLGVQERCLREDLLPALKAHGIALVGWDELSAAQQVEAGEFFDRNVSPALTPLGFDPAHPFPFMSNLSTNWGFLLRAPDTEESVSVRVKIPNLLPQWVPLKTDLANTEWCYCVGTLQRFHILCPCAYIALLLP